MDVLSPSLIIGSIFWGVSALFDTSEFVYLWQLKEYRWDKFRDFLSTQEGKHYIIQSRIVWRVLLLPIVFLWPINHVQALWSLYLVFLFVDASIYLLLWRKGKARRPILTIKAIAILFISIGAEGIFLFLFRDPVFAFVLLTLRFALTSSVVAIFFLPTHLVKQWYVGRAGKKLQQYPNLLVVGITGSYGKTTVKFFLNHLLGGKKRVLATPKSINTDIGVARVILFHDLSQIDILIVEMGAYRRGEIAKICQMVPPQIGILTAINEQHLALFGNIEKIQQAKYELLRAVGPKGLVITNSDNDYCRVHLDQLSAMVETFGKDETYHPTCLVAQYDSTSHSLNATYHISGEEWSIVAPIPGEHNALNIAPCLLVARSLGLSKNEIIERCTTLQLPPATLSIFFYGQATIIDDSFNANPDGFRAALTLLRKFPPTKKHIVITRGIPELGAKAHDVHVTLGKEMTTSVDALVLITEEFKGAFEQGIGKGTVPKIIPLYDTTKLQRYLESLKNESVIILFENRLPTSVYQKILHESHASLP